MVSFGLDRCCSDGGSLFYYSSATFLVALLYLGIFALGVFAIFFPAINMTNGMIKNLRLLLGRASPFLLCSSFGSKSLSSIILSNRAFFFPTVLGLLISVRGYFDTFFWNIINRPSSTQGHWERWSDGIAIWYKTLWGLGWVMLVPQAPALPILVKRAFCQKAGICR
jgi:hypothetical protein